jgi:hypothetical protein
MIRCSVVCIVLLLTAVSFGEGQIPSHDLFDNLLKKHVAAGGKVNYRGFIKDSVELNKYLGQLIQSPPQKNWSKQDEMAYWINAYNAFTIQLVIRYYPVKSIKDIGSRIQIPFANSPWDIRFIRIANEKLDLNTIEHVKLRKQFNDPRIHMALVCASKSCPVLLNQAYQADRLEDQLNRQTRAFLDDPTRNLLDASNPKISMIFDWYQADFQMKGGSVIDFINTYASKKVKPGAKITYLDYDWALND